MKNRINGTQKVKVYVDRLFVGIGDSQQLFDLKEELTTNLSEKMSDYKNTGMTEEEAFKEAIRSLGDLSALVNEMREIGQNQAKQAVYTSMSSRVSAAGIVIGTLIILFGLLTCAMLYSMGLSMDISSSALIFVVIGAPLVIYSVLTRESKTKYAMNRVRALLYSIAIGVILFSILVTALSGFATGEVFIAMSVFMVFFLIGIGIWLSLLFTGTGRRKEGV
ncbi:permease prefix domain 1-containing protein [Halalkalibacter sp. AB-rgal2]|uniref:permease prefix domain 1-containing protein n=1 Tax=Halalkalibacter sp. AB-rgal2 TaxID=3242695 RepID=UPI00359D5605